MSEPLTVQYVLVQDEFSRTYDIIEKQMNEAGGWEIRQTIFYGLERDLAHRAVDMLNAAYMKEKKMSQPIMVKYTVVADQFSMTFDICEQHPTEKDKWEHFQTVFYGLPRKLAFPIMSALNVAYLKGTGHVTLHH